MTTNDLEIELEKVINNVLKDLELQKPQVKVTDTTEYGKVNIYCGFPPAVKRGEENRAIPFLVLRASDGEDKEGLTTTKINLEIMTYKDDDTERGYIGHRNAIMIWEKIRIYLRKKRDIGIFRYISSKWELFQLDGAESGIAVEVSFEMPLIAEEGDYGIIG